MKICGRKNVWKHREINYGEQYVILEISSYIVFIDERGAKSSQSNDYMVRTGKGLTKYLDFRNKRSENKQKAGFFITDITKKGFRKLLERFNNSSYLGYKSKQYHN